MRLRKVTLNLFDEDCNVLARYYGYGWSERVRDLVRQHVKGLKRQTTQYRTVGEMVDALEEETSDE